MLLARTDDGALAQPDRTGQRATCPGCGGQVDAAVGELVIPHWRHHGERDCDPWSGGESDWHLEWKDRAMRSGWSVEVPFGPPTHRADAVGPRGHIVEFQRSSLSVEDMEDRTSFYAGHGPVIWVVDAETYTRRWKHWRYDGSELDALLVLDDGRQLLALDSATRIVRRFGRWGLFDRPLLRMASWAWWRWIPCHTCGTTPSHAFPDGSGAYRCSHSPATEAQDAA